MLSSLRDYLYRGVQRTDGELRHIVKRQSPEAQYQQNQSACGALPEEQEAPCPGCHPERRSEEGGLIQVPWGPYQEIKAKKVFVQDFMMSSEVDL